MVNKFANMPQMKYTIEYFHARVKDEIEEWPAGILADYARLVELLMEFGPNLRMPHSRAMGDGLFELTHRCASRFCKENSRNPGEGITPCPEKNEGGT